MKIIDKNILEKMRNMYENGHSLAEVGDCFNVTRQAVSQLFMRYGIPCRHPNSLANALREWTDVDQAQHELAKCLGLVKFDASLVDHKGTYWTNNPFGNGLYEMLIKLTDMEVLEKRDEPDLQFRWKT